MGSHFSLPVQKGGLENDPPAVEIALVGDDVQGAFDKAVAAGAKAVQNPMQKPWGQTVG